MGNYLNKYKERKDKVLSLLKDVKTFFGEIDAIEAVKTLETHIMNLENGRFSIVVIGQFSAGKSTFLNALMGERFLPSFTEETTATVNFLRSVKDSPTGKGHIEVSYKNGEHESSDDVSLETIEKFVSTKGDNVAQRVESVDIFLDSKFLNDGVSLVDSPGLNGLLEGHRDITYNQMNISHAAIFMFNAAQPGSATDFEIFKDLKDRCKSIIVVLNKIDYIHASEGESPESLVEKLEKDYHKKFPNDTLPEIYPLAAYPALVARSARNMSYMDKQTHTEDDKKRYLQTSRIEKFEDRLMQYLTEGEKAKLELMAPLDAAEFQLSEKKKNLEDKIKDLENEVSPEKYQAEIEELEKEVSKLKESLDGDRLELRKSVREILEATSTKIKAKTRDLREEYKHKISENSDDLDALADESTKYINRMTMNFNSIIIDEISEAETKFRELIIEKYREYALAIEDRLNASAFDENGVEVKTVNINMSVFDIDADVEKEFAKKRALSDKLDVLYDSISEAEFKQARAAADTRKAEKAEKKLVRLDEQYRNDKLSLGNRPPQQQIVKYREERSGGLLGIYKWIYNGNPARQVPYTTLDSSSQESYDNELRELTYNYQQERSRLTEEINKYDNVDSDCFNVEIRQLERKRERIERDLEDATRELQDKYDKNRKQQQRKAAAYVEDCIREIEKNGKDEAVNQLRKLKDSITKIITDVLEESIKEQLVSKQHELTERKEEMQKSEEERQNSIKDKKELLEKIGNFLKNLFIVKDEIDSVIVNEIKTN